MRRKTNGPGRVITDDMRTILEIGVDFFSGGKCEWTQTLGSNRFRDKKLPAKLKAEMRLAWREIRESILRERPDAWALKVFG